MAQWGGRPFGRPCPPHYRQSAAAPWLTVIAAPAVIKRYFPPAGSDPRLLDRQLIERAAYRAAKAPIEAHIFSQGGHGFNMGYRSKLETLKGWPQRLADWLTDNNILKPHE